MSFGYLYVHGFASHAGSFKGLGLRAALAPLGVDVHLPDFNVPSFESMTYTSILGELDRIDRALAPRHWRLIGSSMGGYLAARWAELHPERVDRLVLLCPGFDLASRWPRYLGDEAFTAWERTGTHLIADHEGVLRPLRWEFVEDSRHHPAWPAPTCPILVLHGCRDEVVPVEYSRRYVRDRTEVTYVELDDDHGLVASLEIIAARIAEFFGLRRAGH